MIDFQQGRSERSRADSMVILEDFSDRLNSIYTPIILLSLAAITMANVYFIRPISCSIPELPKNDFAGFPESVCWSQGTISQEKISENVESQREVNISFYQWVPFCLLVQAILFYLPHLIWHTLSNCSFGDNLSYLITRAKTAAVTEDALSRAKLVRACADQLYLLSRQHFNTSTSPWSKFQECLCANRTCGHSCTVEKRMCNHSALYYLLVKVLYILNCIAQVFLAVCLLGQDVSALNALTGFSELLTGQDYGTRLFPHTGRCTVRVPSVVVQSQSYLATCALPVNVLNEKIYLFLWVWTLAVLTLSVGTTLTWIWRLLMRSHRNSFMRSFLYVSLLTPPSFQASEAADLDIMSGSGACQAASLDGALVERFLTEVVGCDGNFMIRMLRLNAGSIVTGEILVTWWRMFKAIESAEDEGEVVEFEPANPQARTFAEMNELGDPLDRMVRRTMSYI